MRKYTDFEHTIILEYDVENIIKKVDQFYRSPNKERLLNHLNESLSIITETKELMIGNYKASHQPYNEHIHSRHT